MCCWFATDTCASKTPTNWPHSSSEWLRRRHAMKTYEGNSTLPSLTRKTLLLEASKYFQTCAIWSRANLWMLWRVEAIYLEDGEGFFEKVLTLRWWNVRKRRQWEWRLVTAVRKYEVDWPTDIGWTDMTRLTNSSLNTTDDAHNDYRKDIGINI